MNLKKILVADRGGTAGAVVAACRDMGLATVGPAPDGADTMAAHLADEALPIAPHPHSDAARHSLIEGAGRLGVDAVHPGSGGLGADPAFAAAVIEAGMTWIGPAPQTLSALADRTTLDRAGADAGMVVTKANAVPHDGNVRLIEVPVFGFGDGLAVHLFSRDASVQDAGAAVLVDAPASHLPSAAAAAMQDAARSLARALNIEGPATVRFLFERDAESIALLHLAPGLDINHVATEMITGIDLIGSQVAQAAGRLEPVDQAEIAVHATALTARISALPGDTSETEAGGEITGMVFPDPLQDLRIDPARRVGEKIDPGVGSHLADVTVRGPDRGTVVDLMPSVLDAVRISGPQSNLDVLDRILRDPVYRLSLPNTGYWRAASYGAVPSNR